MEIELRFKKDDLIARNLLINELGINENSIFEITSFDATSISSAVAVALDTLAKNPSVLDKFIGGTGRMVVFDEEGKILMAKGYSAKDIIKIKHSEQNDQRQKK